MTAPSASQTTLTPLRAKMLQQRVAGKSVRKYTLRSYAFFFQEIEAKSAEFSTPS